LVGFLVRVKVNVGVWVADFLAGFLLGVNDILAGDSNAMAVIVAATAFEMFTWVLVGAPELEDVEALVCRLQAGKLMSAKAAMKRAIFFQFILSPLPNKKTQIYY